MTRNLQLENFTPAELEFTRFNTQRFRHIKSLVALLSLACVVAFTNPARPADKSNKLPTPERVHISSALKSDEVDALLKVARRYYAFWDTGDPAFAKSVLATDFVDLNLPEGRPQGPTGPILASENFRKAVPDLKLTVKDVYVLKDTVIGRLHFSGHFTGAFGKIKGDGRAVSFDAVDIYKINHDRIKTNWHLEDNLTLLTAIGAIGPISSSN